MIEKKRDLKEYSFMRLTNLIRVIAIAVHSNHEPEWGTKTELLDKNSHSLFEIAEELDRRFENMES